MLNTDDLKGNAKIYIHMYSIFIIIIIIMKEGNEGQ